MEDKFNTFYRTGTASYIGWHMSRLKDNQDESYCNRTADEVINKFKDLVTLTDFEKEALTSFDFLRDKKSKGINIEDYKTFIVYFDDLETDLWSGE